MPARAFDGGHELRVAVVHYKGRHQLPRACHVAPPRVRPPMVLRHTGPHEFSPRCEGIQGQHCGVCCSDSNTNTPRDVRARERRSCHPTLCHSPAPTASKAQHATATNHAHRAHRCTQQTAARANTARGCVQQTLRGHAPGQIRICDDHDQKVRHRDSMILIHICTKNMLYDILSLAPLY